MNTYIQSVDAENAIFHVGVKKDGTLQDIINVRLPFGNLALLMKLLNTNRPGGKCFDENDDSGYFFMYDNSRTKPYPSVMVWKYKRDGERRIIVDVQKEDLHIIPYVVDTFLR